MLSENRAKTAEQYHHRERPPLDPGTMVQTYKVIKVIGSGGYGDVYSVMDQESSRICAMKTEYDWSSKHALQEEINIFRRLSESAFFPHLYAYGHQANFTYLIMEMMGPSLSNTRRRMKDHRFTLYSAIRLSLEMLNCVEAFHREGFVHRDIKTGNFLLRPHRDHPLCLIDYGLSAPFLDSNGKHIPFDPQFGYVGTCRYCSTHAHEGYTLSRRDDLISWFYSTIELVEGKVPWPGSDDMALTVKMKKSSTAHTLCRHLPEEYKEIYKYISKLKFEEEPKYRAIKSSVRKALTKIQRSSFDWEDVDTSQFSQIQLTMSGEDPDTESSSFSPLKKQSNCEVC